MATILISIGLIALVVLAVRHIIRNGTCSGCSTKDSCSSASGCGCCHPEELKRIEFHEPR